MSVHRKRIRFNLLSVVLYQVITLAIGFLLPRLYLENFGSAVNGVLSVIKQLFTYLCLLEAGIGLATSQALLRPVAQQNQSSINAILTATQQYYRKTGFVYTAAVVAIALIYGLWIPTGLPPLTVISLVLLNGIPSLVTFFLQGKYQLLLETDGRQYVITNSQMLLQVCSGFGKIAVLLLTDNLVLMQATYCLLSVLQLLAVTVYARRHYRWLNFHVPPDRAAISQKNSVLLHQISSMVFNNTDILLISALCGWNWASVYYIYNLFFSQVEQFIASLVKGFNFALGQLFAVDRETFEKRYDAYEMGYLIGNFTVYTLMGLFLLPLIAIYTNGIQDADYQNSALLLLFVITKLLASAKIPLTQVVEYAGCFSQTAWHAVAEMLINLSVSVVCLLRWGAAGALIGTGAALAFRASVVTWFVNRRILRRPMTRTLLLWLVNGIVLTGLLALLGTDAFRGLSFGALLWRGLAAAPAVLLLYTSVNAAVQPQRFLALLRLVRGKGVLS